MNVSENYYIISRQTMEFINFINNFKRILICFQGRLSNKLPEEIHFMNTWTESCPEMFSRQIFQNNLYSGWGRTEKWSTFKNDSWAILMYFLVLLSSLKWILPSSLYECLYDNVLTSFQGRSDWTKHWFVRLYECFTSYWDVLG